MKNTRPTQKQRILAALRNADGDWVDLPVIMKPDDGPRIGQYNARIWELRKDLYPYWEIWNRSRTIEGEVRSWYYLSKCLVVLTARQKQMEVLCDALGCPAESVDGDSPCKYCGGEMRIKGLEWTCLTCGRKGE